MKIKSALTAKTLVATSIACALAFSAAAQPMRPAESASAKVEDFKPDPKKRLTIEQFVKGANRLHGYLKNAVENAKPEDKKFLVKEKAEIEQQLKDPEKALTAQFKSIDAQIARLQKLNIFPAPLVAKMRMHFLETEAGKAVGVLVNEKKKPELAANVQAEIQYQLGIIAQRDQVNYKTALRHYSNAVKYAPSNVEYLLTLGDLHKMLENNQDASKIYKDALINAKKQAADKGKLDQIKQKLAKATHL